MPFGHSWPSLDSFNATKADRPARKRAAGLRVTAKGVEYYDPSLEPKRERQTGHGNVVEWEAVLGPDGKMHARLPRYTTVGQTVYPKPKRASAKRTRKAEEASVAEVYTEVAGSGSAMSAASDDSKSWATAPAVDVASLARRTEVSTPVERGLRPTTSYAERRAAVRAMRGY